MARGRKGSLKIQLTAKERKILSERQRNKPPDMTDYDFANRCRRALIVLRIANGWPISHIAEELKTTRTIVYKWGWRFAASGLEGLEDGG